MKNIKLLILTFLIISMFASCQTENKKASDLSESSSHSLYDYSAFNRETTQEFSDNRSTAYMNTTEESSASYTAIIRWTTASHTVSTIPPPSVSKTEFTAAQHTASKPAVSTKGTTAVITSKVSTTVKASKPSTTVTTNATTSVITTTAHTHKYVSSVTTAPDCTNNGILTYKCSSCNHSYTEPIPKTGHNYNSEVVAPTKEGKGYTLYSCTACGHSYKGNETFYVPTEQEAYEAIIAKKSEYPDGRKWNNDDSYAWKGGIYSEGYGCAGFAFMLSDAAFGELPARQTDVSNPKVGDILRINNDSHSVVILEVRDDCVVVAEGNFNESVYWGREIPLSVVNAPGTYIITRYPE